MKQNYDLAIVGAGVLGTFHAYHALKKGLKVVLFEKNSFAKSATVQNFGQVVPSGMDLKWQTFGRESLNIYKEIQKEFDISVRQNGSIYIASNDEEVQLIEELAQINKDNNYQSKLLTKAECLNKYAYLKSNYVQAGLFFPEEITVEPRVMIGRLHQFMIQKMGLNLITDATIVNCLTANETVNITTTTQKEYKAQKVIICSGNEFKLLFPETFNNSDLQIVKLQMMLTKPQKRILPGSILTGSTIRRYESFSECPSYKSIKSKEDPNSFLKKWGIHILFKQATDGSIILGDSHEYADAKNADNLNFDLNMEVDQFMIDEAKKIMNLDYIIQNKWYGLYSQCKNNDIFEKTIDKNIHIVTGIGGKGMTGSAGFSKQNMDKILNY